jgi:hypothetical protein
LRKSICLFFFSISVLGSSLSLANPASTIGEKSLADVALQTLQYSLSTQITAKNDPYYWPGEWPALIQATGITQIVGVGSLTKKDHEASAFTTGTIINLLGQIYQDFPERANEPVFQKIPGAIHSGVSTFSRYGSGTTFNFYPLLNDEGVLVRRPIDMKLWPLWYGLTNVPDDADTTSTVQVALNFDALINHTSYQTPDQTFETFSKYRDYKNRRPDFYNRFVKMMSTGAFMTWLMDENDPKMPHNYFSSPKYGQRIPFNHNDVDCVVNANVIRMKAIAHKKNFDGYAESCQMINKILMNDKESGCASYYPNTLNLPFAMAMAHRVGDMCIQPASQEHMIDYILKIQMGDGAWTNNGNFWGDPVLTTAFALETLLEFGNLQDPKVTQALQHGVRFLLTRMHLKSGTPFWDAEHFFTDTAIARSLIMWESEAYTNTIISSVFLRIDRLFPHQEIKFYLALPQASVRSAKSFRNR